jgi:uncharacterized protein (TIGR02117 family)
MLEFGHRSWLHLKLFRINSIWTTLRALVGWPLLAIGLYFFAAVIGSMIPVNGDWKPPARGETVYLYDNGVHTSLILSLQSTPELYLLFADPPVTSPEDALQNNDRFPGPVADYPYIMVGWGDERFYRETPAWGDIKPGTVFAALFGSGRSALHVDRLGALPKNGIKKLTLRRQEYARLLLFVTSQIAEGEINTIPAGPMINSGYGIDDRFYVSKNEYRYSILFTCNNWIESGLERAGIKTSYWSPLPFGVMWWY